MNELTPLRLAARLIKPVVNKPFPPVTPTILVDEATDLSKFGIHGRILHTPGHTSGSISLLLPNGEAIVGDVMMGGFMGGNLLGTRPNYHYYAEDLQAIHASLQKLTSENTHTFYVGHGGLHLKAAVQKTFNL